MSRYMKSEPLRAPSLFLAVFILITAFFVPYTHTLLVQDAAVFEAQFLCRRKSADGKLASNQQANLPTQITGATIEKD